MKHVISMVFAGIIGGLITLAGFQMASPKADKADSVFQKTSLLDKQEANSPQVQFTNSRPVTAVGSDNWSFTKAAEIAMPTVVHITARQTEATANKKSNDDIFDYFFGNPYGGPQQGSGSGVILTEDGYIVTNHHVVEFANEVEVTLYDKRKFKAWIIGKDPTTDLAVLKIEANGLSTMKMSDSDEAQIGEWVLAVGNPFNLTSTVTAGIISAKGRDIQIIEGQSAIESFIQTDAAVNPGNSGGALVDVDGNLLGINTAIATQTGVFEGYSFAIPINIVRKIVDDLVEHGEVKRGFLGVFIVDMDAELAEKEGVKITEGVYIQALVEEGAATKAGVLPGDVITAVDGKEIKNSPELQELVGRGRPGDRVNLTVNRKGKIKEINVTLQQ